MAEQRSDRLIAAADHPEVTIEAIAWVAGLVGGTSSSRVRITEPISHGETVRSVLARLSARYPALRSALWNRGSAELGEHIEVLVNGRFLEAAAGIDQALSAGDSIVLVGQFAGG